MKLNKIKKIICFLMLVVMLVSGVLPTGNVKIVYADDFITESDSLFEEINTAIASAYVDDGVGYAVVQIKDENGNFKYPTVQSVEVLFKENQINIMNDSGVVRNYTFDIKINQDNMEYIAKVTNATWDRGAGTCTITFQTEEGVNAEGSGDVESSGSLESVEEYGTGKGLMDSLEKMLSLMINAIANGVNKLVAVVLGRNVTIDDLVFNHYPETALTYFGKAGSEPSTIIWGPDGDGVGGIRNTVNEWFSLFRNISIIVYMIMLVYMGIRIMLSSTGQSTAQYKTLFINWVVGAIILFFYPYAMRYTIELNNAFVRMVDQSKTVLTGGVSIKNSSLKSETISSIQSFDFDENPFNWESDMDNTYDYMSNIATDANASLRFALSLTYMVLTWQLLMLIIHYYKRVLMIGFLIAIFPLVAISYAIDKVADGKSQSFNKWNKEFMLNVLVQSFHAIVYVFVCGTIYSASSSNGYDYVLIITGVTFMFTGEEIIKKIFSQESPAGSVTSLVATTAMAVGAANLAKKTVSTVTKPIIGKESVYNRVRNSVAEIRTANTRVELFDRFARPMTPPNVGLRLSHTSQVLDAIDARTDLTEQEKRAMKAETINLANSVATLNNPNSHSAEELGKAYATVQQAMASDPSNPILQDSTLSREQLTAMRNVGTGVAAMIAAGTVDSATIKRTIKMELGYILDGLDERSMEKYTNAFFAEMNNHGVSRGFTREGTEEELNNLRDEVLRLNDSFRYAEYSHLSDEEIEMAARRRDDYAARIVEEARNWSEATEFDDEAETTLAKSIAIYMNRSSGAYTAEQQLEAIEKMRELADTNDTTRALMDNLGDEDLDISRHVLAKKIVDYEHLSDDVKERAREVLEEYEGDDVDIRADLYDDEVSIHEVIKNSRDGDEFNEMTTRIHTARRMTNQREREISSDIATEILAEDRIDITEGGLDTETPLFEGMTREELVLERSSTVVNAFRRIAGMKTDGKNTGLFPGEKLRAERIYRGQGRPGEEEPGFRTRLNNALDLNETARRTRDARQANYDRHSNNNG